jgi:cytoskeletal protein CcmA (bactofilin family)
LDSSVANGDAGGDDGISGVGALVSAVAGQQVGSRGSVGSVLPGQEVDGSKIIPGSYVVPKGYRISGVVISHRPVVVRGELIGRGVSASEVLVDECGVLRAPAEVERLRVFGRVLSSVRATLVVEVLSGGEIQADLETPGLSVAPGGRVSGGLLKVGAE